MVHQASPSLAPAVRKSRGFTLVELLIAMVVLAVITALAFPSFMGSIRKSRRSEAYTAISAVQLKQERWRTNNPTYASSLIGAWPGTGLGLSATTPSNYYTIAIVSPAAGAPSATDDRNYEITATAVAGSSQAKDGDCAQLGVQMLAGNLKYGSAPATGTLSYSDTDRCWSR